MRSLHIVLRHGFRGHSVAVTVDGREVYQRDSVSTDADAALADTLDLIVSAPMVRVALSATPGDYCGSIDLDVVAHPHLVISLVGEGTVSFEISTHDFT